MKKLIMIAALLGLAGCSVEDSMHMMMETAMNLQFTEACQENQSCVKVVDSHMEACYTKDDTMAMLNAGSDEATEAKFEENIHMVQACLSEKGGEDFWKDVDWSQYQAPQG